MNILSADGSSFDHTPGSKGLPNTIHFSILESSSWLESFLQISGIGSDWRPPKPSLRFYGSYKNLKVSWNTLSYRMSLSEVAPRAKLNDSTPTEGIIRELHPKSSLLFLASVCFSDHGAKFKSGIRPESTAKPHENP